MAPHIFMEQMDLVKSGLVDPNDLDPAKKCGTGKYTGQDQNL